MTAGAGGGWWRATSRCAYLLKSHGALHLCQHPQPHSNRGMRMFIHGIIIPFIHRVAKNSVLDS